MRKVRLPTGARLLNAISLAIDGLPCELTRLRTGGVYWLACADAAHADLFASVDMVVSTERTCLRVKRHIRGRMPQFAIVPHGAGDRNVSYHPDFARFDLVLVAGQKVVEQMVAHGVAPDRLRITGYPKFDSIDWARRFDPFGNGRPTFVYNPHFDPKLSSWYDMGPGLLRWFAGPQGQAYFEKAGFIPASSPKGMELGEKLGVKDVA